MLVFLSPFISERLRAFDKKYIKKILVIRMDRLGDFIVTTPLLKTLKKELPSSRITLLAKKDICELAAKQPWVDDIIEYDNAYSFLGLIRKVRSGHFDLAIDCLSDYTLRTALLAYASRAPYRLGFDIAKRGVFFNIKVQPVKYERSMAEETLNLASGLMIKPDGIEPEITVSDAERSAVNNFMNSHGIMEESLLIAIHPGARYPSQRWGADKFVDLVSRLSENSCVDVILLGSEDELPLLKYIKDMSGPKTHIFYTGSLNMLAAVIDRVKLFVGNNSGPLHMASALGKRTVSTIGPTDGHLWAPSGKRHIVLNKEVGCSPCNKSICKEHKCMKLITLDEMFKAALLQIERIIEEDE